MTKLEQLVIRRAEILRQIKIINLDSSDGYCTEQYQEKQHIHFGPSIEMVTDDNCIQRIYKETAELNKGSGHGAYGDFYSYDEVFYNTDDQPCEHCKKVRENKKKRSVIRRELGNVNSQITQIGNRLIKSSGQ